MISQTINKSEEITWDIASITQAKTEDRWSVNLVFQAKDIKGVKVYEKEVRFFDDNYNEFWANYTNGSFIMEILMESLGIEAELPKDVETFFVNKPLPKKEDKGLVGPPGIHLMPTDHLK